ncbi:hypothetical protein [Billgrantia endophytica]|uniref:Biotin carboxylation domain-containing protein n=1 Tax=Billgrantia endophytica TaxID=2033802 RepID=A0A2N7U933_9GAMM|nr:hypothetical protein [Halomonas endophytica]PMR76940.1 hypothetical protein C1H69_04385 [Halomonas endophytica]
MQREGSLREKPRDWRRIMVAGTGLAALRAGQACTELGLAWCDSAGETGNALVARARRLGCDVLHPGEAGPAEQLGLAQASRQAGLVFIGQREALMAAMHDNQASRQLLREAGVPLSQAGRDAARLLLPVLVDRKGQALALIEHEILDETTAMAPSDRLTPEQRVYLGRLAIQGARAMGLVGLATMSFTLEGNRLGFDAMRPGLTGREGLAEALTGLDLSVEQLRLVAGERLRRPRVGHMGHGPGRPGQARLRLLHTPRGRLGGGPGVRLDQSSDFGESMARLLVWGRDGAEASRRERRALTEWNDA